LIPNEVSKSEEDEIDSNRSNSIAFHIDLSKKKLFHAIEQTMDMIIDPFLQNTVNEVLATKTDSITSSREHMFFNDG
jgi:hypothetical protein